MRDKLRWLEYALWMKDDRLPKTILFGQLSRDKQKAGHPRLGRGDVVKKDLREKGTFWEGCKEGGFEKNWDEVCVTVLASGSLML